MQLNDGIFRFKLEGKPSKFFNFFNSKILHALDKSSEKETLNKVFNILY